MNPHIVVSRRAALKTMGAGVAALGLGTLSAAAASRKEKKKGAGSAGGGGTRQPFTLPKLGYAYDALEPHIDARTMEIHHTKHHQAYITNAMNALKGQSSLENMTAEEMLRDLSALPESVRTTLRNNVGGHLNHTLFWRMIGPKQGAGPKGPVADAINQTFGSFDQFKTQFANAASGRFGSGWAWLTLKDGKLAVTSTANQDNPVSEGAAPLLGLDVWEHAYYLKYQNRRADYIGAFWNVVNWDEVGRLYAAAK